MTREELSPNNGRRWSNRSLVREPDEQRTRSLLRVLLALAVALAPTAFYVVQQNECLEARYELERLVSERERLVLEEQTLKIKLARLESFSTIERWATNKRGLEQPDPQQVVVVAEEAPETNELVARSRPARPGAVR